MWQKARWANAVVLMIDATKFGDERAPSWWFIGRCDLVSLPKIEDTAEGSVLFVGEFTREAIGHPKQKSPRSRKSDSRHVDLQRVMTFPCEDLALEAKARTLRDVIMAGGDALSDAQRDFAETALALVAERVRESKQPEEGNKERRRTSEVRLNSEG